MVSKEEGIGALAKMQLFVSSLCVDILRSVLLCHFSGEPVARRMIQGII